ncbi:MlaD family protein [Dasania sp. GY-MA-18]|uniref:MlaD family protein n=1 Tax=Dasania phycosphaerae TaxID=2950436 RepID=A0A9J6RHC0_9GAMM|nr:MULTISPECIES: MlaD family protein [Dasania]MCR8921301.1 MlaD family protein [Dasania sp. GY-MA-18]MCZ0863729.1 MlaD family protein [Dasania phycosphaerae]MCZ0867457.1 MlaD family protein [Dasania phycosphaerae]
MERHAKFILVGGFILLSLAGLTLFKLWISPADKNDKLAVYHIVFRGSVSGLSVGSEVRYLGVAIGRVNSIAINKQQLGHVDVSFNSEQQLPHRQLLAQLEPKGITGLAVVELRLKTTTDASFANIGDSIPGYPSLFTQLGNSASATGNNAKELLSNINQLFKPDNIAHLSNSIQQLDLATANLAYASKDMAELLGNLNNNSRQLQKTLSSYQQVGAKLDQALLPSLQAATDSAQHILGNSEANINRLFEQQIPKLVGISDQLSFSLQRINELASGLSNQPQQLIYGKSLPQLEVDIARQ